jgi:hypothetical protein
MMSWCTRPLREYTPDQVDVCDVSQTRPKYCTAYRLFEKHARQRNYTLHFNVTKKRLFLLTPKRGSGILIF